MLVVLPQLVVGDLARPPETAVHKAFICCTAHPVGPTSAELPPWHSGEVHSVHVQEQPDEGGNQEQARLVDAGRAGLHGEPADSSANCIMIVSFVGTSACAYASCL